MDPKQCEPKQCEPKQCELSSMDSILLFFTKNKRCKNDASNKERENILVHIRDLPDKYKEHPEFGKYWTLVQNEWTNVIHTIAKDSIPSYTSWEVTRKGGRGCHHDFVFVYYNGTKIVGSRNIEFKYGAKNIDELPQFLSLQAKYPLFKVTFDEYWYEHWIDKYIACDTEIHEPKPSREVYLKCVTNTNYSIHPFITRIKERELFFQKDKNRVVNEGITDYLKNHGHTLNIGLFSEKVKETQTDKHYILWSDGTFHLDKLQEEMSVSEMVYHSIKNGNVLEVKAGNTLYRLLLRWRNHKGILNPAWQISMKRMKRMV